MAIQTEKQLQQQAVLARNLAVNGVKAQKLFFANELDQAEAAIVELTKKVSEFEDEATKGAVSIEKKVAEEVQTLEKGITGQN